MHEHERERKRGGDKTVRESREGERETHTHKHRHSNSQQGRDRDKAKDLSTHWIVDINPFVCLGVNKLVVDEQLGGWLKKTIEHKLKKKKTKKSKCLTDRYA